MTIENMGDVLVERHLGLSELFPRLAERAAARGADLSTLEVTLITERRRGGPCNPSGFASRVVSMARARPDALGKKFFFCSRTGFVRKPTERYLRLWKKRGMSMDLSSFSILSEEPCAAFDEGSGSEGVFYAGAAEVEGRALDEVAGMMAAGPLRGSSFLYLAPDFQGSPIANFAANTPRVGVDNILSYKEGPLEPFGLLDAGIPSGDAAIFFLHNGDENEAYVLEGREGERQDSSEKEGCRF